MRKRSKVLAIVGLALASTLLLSSAAQAYPPKSTLKNHVGYWICNPLPTLDFGAERYQVDVDTNNPRSGRYAYKRDRGKVIFRTGPHSDMYAKVRSDNGYGWVIHIYKKSNDDHKAACGATVIGY